MSTEIVSMYAIRCDSCGVNMDDEEFGGPILYPTEESARAAATEAIKNVAEWGGDGWTENGDGKHNCPACAKLTLSDDAIAERGRAIGPGDVPLDFGGLT